MRNIWDNLATEIVRWRIIGIIFLLITTAFFAYFSQNVRLSYESAKTIPSNDRDMLVFQGFLQTFGEEGNLLAIGMKDSSIFQLSKFQAWRRLCQSLAELKGVSDIIAVPTLQYLYKDTTQKKFQLRPLFEKTLQNQAELDSLWRFAQELKFYEGQVFNPKTGAMLMILSIDKKVLNSAKRLDLMKKITNLGSKFSQQTNVQLYYAGLPYIRTIMATLVKQELQIFLIISLLITILVVFLFFRSLYPILVTVLLIATSVIWCLGIMGILGYKITILSGIIPPILVIIAIPNCVYLITKYHQEYRLSQNKNEALHKVVAKIGFVTVIANITTATGFFVFLIGEVAILQEFGLITGLSVLCAMFISLLILPIAFYYLPAPTSAELKHLDRRGVAHLIKALVVMAQRYRWQTYTLTFIILVLSLWGISRLKVLAFMVDDLPQKNNLKTDLAFFETHFKGIMPVEIIVDTGKKKGIQKLKNLQLVDSLETFLSQLPQVGKPISMVGFMKTASHTYYNYHPDYYRLPEKREMAFILSYLKKQKDERNLMRAFIDSAESKIRLSLKVCDMGSIAMDKLVKEKIQPKITQLFKDTNLKVSITGSAYLFVKGNDYLVNSLKMSILAAIFFVALAHGILFMNIRMMLISIIPNLIPMLITAGLMGFLGIPLKPSTAIVFSIVFGIAVDDTVHFLARYRLELKNTNDVVQAVLISIRETGHSMIYTSLVLFAGFFIFTLSQFGGTIALGLLTSTTLLMALLTNLTILPIILLQFDSVSKKIDGNV